jgi:hypothetical protein
LCTGVLYLDELVPHGARDEGLPQSSQEVLDAAAQNVNVNLRRIKQLQVPDIDRGLTLAPKPFLVGSEK